MAMLLESKPNSVNASDVCAPVVAEDVTDLALLGK